MIYIPKLLVEVIAGYWTLPRVPILVLVTALFLGALSVYIHSPSTPTPLGNPGLKYSDIVYGVFYTRFSDNPWTISEYWYNPEVLKSLLGGTPKCPVPYIDYKFEYPPTVGVLWYASTCFAIMTSSPGSVPTASDFYKYRYSISVLHFTIHAAVLLGSLIAIAVIMTILSSALSVEGHTIATALWLLLPSTVLYSTYNWDLLCGAMALGSLLLFHRKKYFASGALLGLSVATKIMTAFIAYVLFLYLLVRALRGVLSWRRLTRFTGGLLLFGASPYLALSLVAPRGFSHFISHHATWYCENCIYGVFVHDIFSPLHRVLAISSITSLAVLVAWFVISHENSVDTLWLYRLATCTLMGGILFNYVFSPQMVLLFSPLLLIFFSTRSTIIYITSDVANFLLMFFFFLDAELRAMLSSLGLPIDVVFKPWTIDSPVQWVAAFRNFSLLSILLIELLRLHKSASIARSS